ncbi:Uncharacterised protein [Mycobacteroides abscessus subsp. abscessus]|nr:Uncharacterised protein [Mycobacteroides abscessus subsp. abscessus]
MYCVRAGERGSGDDPVDVEVGLSGRRAGKVHGLVGVGDVPRVGVGVGIDRDGGDAEIAASAEHPPRDLATVGDQDLADLGHRHHIRNTP